MYKLKFAHQLENRKIRLKDTEVGACIDGGTPRRIWGGRWFGLAPPTGERRRTSGGGIAWRNVRLALIASVNGVVHLLAMDWHILGRDDAKPDLVSSDFHNSHDDIVIDHYTLILFPREYQHLFLLSGKCFFSRDRPPVSNFSYGLNVGFAVARWD
jgi:hypothetical protein